MRVMTFNLKTDHIFTRKNSWDVRGEVVYEIIKDLDCDIIGTQEVSNKIYNDIKNSIENYSIIGKPRCKKLFVERNNIFIKEEYDIENDETFWLSNKPNKEGSSIWHSLFPRICTTAVIKINGRKIRVYNTHLDCLLPKTRELGLKIIKKYMEDLDLKENLPIILMGDFNARPSSNLIKNFNNGMINNKRLIAVQEKNKDLYSKSTFRNKRISKHNIHIDYIFVSEEFEIKDVKIIEYNKNGVYPSDHYPLMADIELK